MRTPLFALRMPARLKRDALRQLKPDETLSGLMRALLRREIDRRTKREKQQCDTR